MRKAVAPVRSAAGRSRLLWGKDHTPRLSTAVTPAELDAARTAAAAVPWSTEARDAFEAILRELAREGVQPGDRRQFKTVGLVRAYAWVGGDEVVMPEHLEVAAHTLWDDPQEQPAVAARAIGRIANPVGMRITQFLVEAEQVVAATDARNLAAAATAAAKLGEIERQLGALTGHARLAAARDHVRDQLRKLKIASIEAV